MNFERQVGVWFAAAVLVAALLWLLSDILLPFVAGMALAFFLNPLTNLLERWGVRRSLAALAIVGFVVLAFVVLALLVVPVLANQLSALITNIPGYVARLQGVMIDSDLPWLKQFTGSEDSSKTISDVVAQGAGWLASFLRSLWSGGRSLISIFSLIVVTPVVAFYLICDWPLMLDTVENWIPLRHRDTANALVGEINAAIAGFVRGQTGVCLILGSFYAVALTFAGLNFGLAIGLMSGLITFIPYVGSMTGLVLSVAVAVAQFWPEWQSIMVVLGIFLFGQFVEGYILAPKFVGENIGVHPVWLMFAMFAFGYFFGFVGLLVAGPLAAALGVLFRFALRQYFTSELFTGNKQA